MVSITVSLLQLTPLVGIIIFFIYLIVFLIGIHDLTPIWFSKEKIKTAVYQLTIIGILLICKFSLYLLIYGAAIFYRQF